MEIRRSKPFARGVTELHYVGDSEPGTCKAGVSLEDLPLAAILGLVAYKTKGITRLAAAAGAVYVAAWNSFWVPAIKAGSTAACVPETPGTPP